ncbi:MAG TPA: dihydrolipoamide acetyltransferase family protein [Solirubrobacteraceae bacterium]|nr:dihydrolipoamide acetyltransferase family protein [Solirubrobacteraceae bacterium]
MSDAATTATATEIPMPRLSDSMEEGTILRWLVADGQHVARGQELVEIETDKASMTYEADAEGALSILVAEGETVAVGVPIARVGGSGAAPDPAAASDPAPKPEPNVQAAPNGHGPSAPVRATPLARRAAGVHHVSLAGLAGSGPRGRIVQADVLSAAGVAPAPAEPRIAAPAPAAPPTAAPAPGVNGAKGGSRRVEPTRAQALIARRMAEAKATIPEFQVQTEVRLDAAIAFRAELKGILEREAPSLNDLVVKACALALRGHPRANGSYLDGGFELHERVNVGVAVAAEEALVVPVVQDADTKSLGQIARETRALAERVRLGQITPPELAGGTFTVSNLGMYGMTAIVPVINPPQAAILGVGAARTVLAREQGEIVERTLMTLTLSCDHRILYGADAALFLAEVKGLLEAPLQLAL